MTQDQVFSKEILTSLGIQDGLAPGTHFEFKGTNGQDHVADSLSEGILFRLLEKLNLHVTDHCPFISKKLHIETHFDFYVDEWQSYIEVNGAQHWTKSLEKRSNVLVNDYVKRLDAMKHHRNVVDIDSRLIRLRPLEVFAQLEKLNNLLLERATDQKVSASVITLNKSHQLMRQRHHVVKQDFNTFKENDANPVVQKRSLQQRSEIWSNSFRKDDNFKRFCSAMSKRGFERRPLLALYQAHVFGVDASGNMVFSITKKRHCFDKDHRTGSVSLTDLEDPSLPNSELVVKVKSSDLTRKTIWNTSQSGVKLSHARVIKVFASHLDLISYLLDFSKQTEQDPTESLAVFDQVNPAIFEKALPYYTCSKLEKIVSMDSELDKQLEQVAKMAHVDFQEYDQNKKLNEEEDIEDAPSR